MQRSESLFKAVHRMRTDVLAGWQNIALELLHDFMASSIILYLWSFIWSPTRPLIITNNLKRLRSFSLAGGRPF